MVGGFAGCRSNSHLCRLRWGRGGDTSPPAITNVGVTPTQVRLSGEVTISAVVSDPSGVARVWAVVQHPDGSKAEVELVLANNAYSGKATVTNWQNQLAAYRVWVQAEDRRGNRTPEPGEPKGGVEVQVTGPSITPKPAVLIPLRCGVKRRRLLLCPSPVPKVVKLLGKVPQPQGWQGFCGGRQWCACRRDGRGW